MEHQRRLCRAVPAPADEDDLLVRVEFGEASREFSQWDELGTRNVTGIPLVRFANIDNEGATLLPRVRLSGSDLRYRWSTEQARQHSLSFLPESSENDAIYQLSDSADIQDTHRGIPGIGHVVSLSVTRR